MRRVLEELRSHPLHYLLPMIGLIGLAFIVARGEHADKLERTPQPAVEAAIGSIDAPTEVHSTEDRREEAQWLRSEARVARQQERAEARRARRRARSLPVPSTSDTEPQPARTQPQRRDLRFAPRPGSPEAPARVVDPRRRLTQREVDAASRGTLAIQQGCIYETKGEWKQAARG